MFDFRIIPLDHKYCIENIQKIMKSNFTNILIIVRVDANTDALKTPNLPPINFEPFICIKYEPDHQLKSN